MVIIKFTGKKSSASRAKFLTAEEGKITFDSKLGGRTTKKELLSTTQYKHMGPLVDANA